jgi:hypothetical protein
MKLMACGPHVHAMRSREGIADFVARWAGEQGSYVRHYAVHTGDACKWVERLEKGALALGVGAFFEEGLG